MASLFAGLGPGIAVADGRAAVASDQDVSVMVFVVVKYTKYV